MLNVLYVTSIDSKSALKVFCLFCMRQTYKQTQLNANKISFRLILLKKLYQFFEVRTNRQMLVQNLVLGKLHGVIPTMLKSWTQILCKPMVNKSQ